MFTGSVTKHVTANKRCTHELRKEATHDDKTKTSDVRKTHTGHCGEKPLHLTGQHQELMAGSVSGGDTPPHVGGPLQHFAYI